MTNPSNPEFWRGKYFEPTQGWELGRAAPPLERWFDDHAPRGKRALVIGCGRGHEARMLARRGAAVVAIDFVEEALVEARHLAAVEGLTIDFRRRDLFALAGEPERYDLVVEHTCFCAIEPARRGEYFAVVSELLVDGGELVGLFYTHRREGGPPFAVDTAALERLYAPSFVRLHLSVPPDSIERRRGEETLVQLQRRGRAA